MKLILNWDIFILDLGAFLIFCDNEEEKEGMKQGTGKRKLEVGRERKRKGKRRRSRWWRMRMRSNKIRKKRWRPNTLELSV